MDGDGDEDAFISDSRGNINFYENTGDALSPVYAEMIGAGNPMNGFDFGGSSRFSFVDVDGDGDMDAFIGEVGGTITFIENIGTAIAPSYTERIGVIVHLAPGTTPNQPVCRLLANPCRASEPARLERPIG